MTRNGTKTCPRRASVDVQKNRARLPDAGLRYVPMHRINHVPGSVRFTAAQWAWMALLAVSAVALIVVALDLLFWRP